MEENMTSKLGKNLAPIFAKVEPLPSLSETDTFPTNNQARIENSNSRA
jgi:hypothetical protein